MAFSAPEAPRGAPPSSMKEEDILDTTSSRDDSVAAQDRRRWYVPRSFRVGKSRKVHVGVQRRGDTIILACGMAGYIGSDWLIPTDDLHEEVTCGHCLRATT